MRPNDELPSLAEELYKIFAAGEVHFENGPGPGDYPSLDLGINIWTRLPGVIPTAC